MLPSIGNLNAQYCFSFGPIREITDARKLTTFVSKELRRHQQRSGALRAKNVTLRHRLPLATSGNEDLWTILIRSGLQRGRSQIVCLIQISCCFVCAEAPFYSYNHGFLAITVSRNICNNLESRKAAFLAKCPAFQWQ